MAIDYEDVKKGKQTATHDNELGKKVKVFEEDDIAINGDKVIAFINAIKSLGDILESVNVIEIRGPFLMGSKMQRIDDIIEIQKRWKEVVFDIEQSLANTGKVLEFGVAETERRIVVMKHYSGLINSTQFASALEKAEKFTNLLDQIEHHKQSGTLEILSKLL